jgi:hypothetical protein
VNFCRACRQDFGSVSAFDTHRTGKHAYTYLEGLDMDPSKEDGRRCLDEGELTALGWRRDNHGRWRQAAPKASVRFRERPNSPSQAETA